jgi:hypothetical protein
MECSEGIGIIVEMVGLEVLQTGENPVFEFVLESGGVGHVPLAIRKSVFPSKEIGDLDEFAVVFSKLGPRLNTIGGIASSKPGKIGKTVSSIVISPWIEFHDICFEAFPIIRSGSTESVPQLVVRDGGITKSMLDPSSVIEAGVFGKEVDFIEEGSKA